MTDSKNGKGGFKEFAKHEKAPENTMPQVLTHPGAHASIPDSAAPKADGGAKKSVKK